MALQDSLDNLLIKMDGKVHLKDAYEWLSAKYSKETIKDFITEHSKKYEIKNDYILSEDLQIESFIFKLKDVLRNRRVKNADISKIIIYKYVTAFEPAFNNEEMEWQVKTLEANDRYLLNEIEHLLYPLDVDYFFNRKTRYKFTSRLFEFLLSEEFREYGMFTTPPTIIQLFIKLLPDLDEVKVYNPAAGILNLATALEVNSFFGIEIKASELNRKVYEYGNLFAKINNININYTCSDSANEISNINRNEFDVVISNLPFNVKINPLDFRIRYTDLAFHIISESLRILKSNGKAVFLINESVLYSNTRNAKDFRREIIESGYLTGIIILPVKTLIFSSVKSCILIFNKSNKDKYVRYVDASSEDYYKINRDKSHFLKVDKILTELGFPNGFSNDEVREPSVTYGKETSSKIISLPDIRNNNYDLSIGRYLINTNEFGEEHRNIKDILRPIRLQKINSDKQMVHITLSELNGYQLEITDETVFIQTDSKIKVLNEPAILIGTVKDKYSPTYFDGSFTINPWDDNIAIYSFDSEKIYPPYLIQELKADYVKKQMNLLAKGSIVKRISKTDLGTIRIKIPTLEVQKRIYSARIDFSEYYTPETTTTTSTITPIREEKTISDADFFKTFKHEIGNILKGPEGFLDLLPKFLVRKNISLDSPIVDSEPDSIGQMMEMATSKINQVFKVMDNMKGILFSDKKYFNPVKTDLKDFIETCFKKEITNGNIKWFVLINNSYTSKRNIEVEIDINQFEYLIRNMVINADTHGRKSEKINLIVNLVALKEETIIEFINDGEPLSANFNIEDFIAYGRKSGMSKGQGLGGYLINRVVKNHSGTIDILQAGKKFNIPGETIEAKVHFSISIPKIL